MPHADPSRYVFILHVVHFTRKTALVWPTHIGHVSQVSTSVVPGFNGLSSPGQVYLSWLEGTREMFALKLLSGLHPPVCALLLSRPLPHRPPSPGDTTFPWMCRQVCALKCPYKDSSVLESMPPSSRGPCFPGYYLLDAVGPSGSAGTLNDCSRNVN